MKYTVFFDLGNVLLFFDHHKMKQQVATCCNLSLEKTSFLLQKYLDDYERGSITTQTLYSDLLELGGKSISFTDFTHALSNIFQPNLPVIALLEKMKARGVKLFLLSNTCDAHFSFAQKHFAFLLQSEYMSAWEPSFTNIYRIRQDIQCALVQEQYIPVIKRRQNLQKLIF